MTKMTDKHHIVSEDSVTPGRGGGLPYITDGDADQNFQKQPLKVMMSVPVRSSMGVHPRSVTVLNTCSYWLN